MTEATTPATDSSPEANKKLVLNVLSAALLGQTVRAQTHKRVNDRITGHVQNILVPVGFIGPVEDGIKIPASSAAPLTNVLSQTLVNNGILSEGAFSISVTKLPPEKKQEPQVQLKVTVHDYSKVDVEKARQYLETRAADPTLQAPNDHHARILRDISGPQPGSR